MRLPVVSPVCSRYLKVYTLQAQYPLRYAGLPGRFVEYTGYQKGLCQLLSESLTLALNCSIRVLSTKAYLPFLKLVPACKGVVSKLPIVREVTLQSFHLYQLVPGFLGKDHRCKAAFLRAVIAQWNPVIFAALASGCLLPVMVRSAPIKVAAWSVNIILNIVPERVDSYQRAYAKYNRRDKQQQPAAVAAAIAQGHFKQPAKVYFAVIIYGIHC
jgi:hypothetical protein